MPEAPWIPLPRFSFVELPDNPLDPYLATLDLVPTADLQAGLEAVAATLERRFPVTGCGLWIPDAARTQLQWIAGVGRRAEAGERSPLPLYPPEANAAAAAWHTGRATCVPTAGPTGETICLYLPLRRRDETLIWAVEGSSDLLAPEALQVLSIFARFLPSYLIPWELPRPEETLARLSRLALLANEITSLEAILFTITREIVELLRGDRGAIARMAEGGDHLVVAAEYNPIGTPSGLGVTIPIEGNPSMQWILRERRPLTIADVGQDPILGPVGPVLQRLGIRSLLIVPLLVGDRVIGTLGIDSVRRPRIFTPVEQQLAMLCAASVAGAVERVRLLEETRWRAAHLETLHAILQHAMVAQDLKALMENALGRLREALNVPMGAIWLEGHAVLHHLPEGMGAFTATAARTAGLELREPIAVTDWEALTEDHLLQPLRPVMARWGIRSSLTVPIGSTGRGGLSLAAPQPRVWRPEEIALVQAVAQELEAVVERLRLWQDLRRQAVQLHVLYQTAQALARVEALPELMDRALEEILTHLPADAASVHILDREEPQTLRLVAARGFSPLPSLTCGEAAETITGRVVATREPLWVEDCTRYTYPPATRSLMEREGFRTHAALPLQHRDAVVGVLNVLWRRPRPLDGETRALLQSLADLLATGIERARLLERIQQQAAELQTLNRALGEALRLREEMIQNVSHELRTPLAVAIGYLELLADGALGPLNDAQREAVKISRDRLGELHRYVELLLTMQAARAGELARQPFDLTQLLREAVRHGHARLDPERHRLRVNAPEAPIWLIGDPVGLARALAEVLDNAIKFSPHGGTIEIALTVEGGFVALCIRDEGIGIPPERLSRVGEPFYQVEGGTTRRFPGMGIGLAAARAVVEAHGGTLHVRPRSPRGTEVQIRLPIGGAPSAPTNRSEAMETTDRPFEL